MMMHGLANIKFTDVEVANNYKVYDTRLHIYIWLLVLHTVYSMSLTKLLWNTTVSLKVYNLTVPLKSECKSPA